MKTYHVVAAIIKQDDKIFATQRGYGDYKDGWEFPGGKIEPGETPEQALIREIQEELAMTIEVDRHIVDVAYDYPQFHLEMGCFLCSIADGTPCLLEHEAAKWLSSADIDSVDWLPADVLVVDALKRQGVV
jgi:8-oxo-dGTP diphosphatase